MLNVYKPAGITSFDVIRILRRKLGIKKIGHGGTLDPIAEGVLIILVGKATKKSDNLIGLHKSYRAGLLLGVETDSYDVSGKVVKETDAGGILLEDIEKVIAGFRGE
ncbi:MAG: tRNA pseudouridine(55) synthase TruB, partial [FCB group bacterium]|nr:tRNA pseudouridine(55) synthase TruB [FCB group bacterium]